MMPEQDMQEVNEIISQLSEASMADTVGLLMQNAITIQQSMQTVTNASVSSSCALILAQGGS
ncbi:MULTISPECIES: RebB family R body protein [Thalassomonas]|uniref:RebB family R body protein n=1 Tax=Thalassomonas actiniarum TaxID=485447 RepID=A0AAE9YPE4_9GAMM|nr:MULTISPECIES: RebB family R body protein [Thalassomonas]WDD98053.1 RebB family R body protein [Thalassomonas actiniarum]